VTIDRHLNKDVALANELSAVMTGIRSLTMSQPFTLLHVYVYDYT